MQHSSRPIEPNCAAQSGRVLVVGGSGNLGRLLRLAWVECGQGGLLWQDRRTGPLVFDPLAEPERFSEAAEGADAILNLAGVVRGDGEALAFNTDLALAALRAGQAAGVGRVFLVSSAAVYGAPQDPVSEDTELSPLSDYGRAKAEMERAVAAWREKAGPTGPAVTILRIGNVAGADQLLGVEQGAEPQMLDIFEDGVGPARSYIGPQTLSQVLGALAELAHVGKPLPDVLNVALEGTVHMESLLDADDRRWEARTAPGSLPRRVELDVARLKAIIPSLPRADAAGIVAEFRALVPKAEGRL